LGIFAKIGRFCPNHLVTLVTNQNFIDYFAMLGFDQKIFETESLRFVS